MKNLSKDLIQKIIIGVLLIILVILYISRGIQNSYNDKLNEVMREYETVDLSIDEAEEVDEAALIAKAYGCFGSFYSDEVLESFVDFVLNRVDAQLYGDTTIEEVILRPKQWQGWMDNAPVVKSIYDKVKLILDDRQNGGTRSIPSSLLYFTCGKNGITYMTALSGGNTWYVGE